MKRHIRILAVIFSVSLNLAFLVGYGFRRVSDRPRFAYEELTLSGEQRARIEAGRDRFLKALDEIREKIIARHLELIDLIATDPTDQQAIEAKFQAIHSLQQSMQRVVVDHLLEDRQTLTPDQQARFFAILKSRIRAQGAPGPPWLPAGAEKRR